MRDYIIQKIRTILEGININYNEIDIEPSHHPNGEFIWESRLSFKLAKIMKRSPLRIAEDIAKEWGKDKFVDVKAVKGYLNFIYKEKGIKELLKEDYKLKKINRKIIVEYPSVNPNKPLHIGHLRNALIGDSIANLYEEEGYETIRMNYIDDLGLQVAQSLWGIMSNPINDINEKYDHYLGKEYVKVAKLIEEDKQIKKEIEDIMHKLEEGKNDISSKGREMAEKCVAAQIKTLYDYKLKQKVLVWESDILHEKIFQKAMKILEEKGVLMEGTTEKNRGCKVVPLSKHPNFANLKDGDKIFIRSNGVATYTAKDVAFQMWKFGILKGIKFDRWRYFEDIDSSSKEGKEKEYNNADIVINIIGKEQEYPQKVIRTIFDMIEEYKNYAKNYIHLSYAHARLKEGKFSGRKGTWQGYTADNLLKEGIKKAKEILKERNNYEQKDIERISKGVAIAAIKYAFLKVNPDKELIFDWNKALSFEGDSGPYIQYSLARAKKILKKEGIDKKWQGKITYETQIEKQLIKEIAVEKYNYKNAIKNNNTTILLNYITNLAAKFNKFYAEARVINCKREDVKETRKRILNKYIKIMEKTMKILGIPILEKM